MNLRNLLAVAVFLLSAISARAESPETFARTMFAAMAERGMNAIPEFTHPDELQRFKDITLPFMQMMSETSEQMRQEAFGRKSKVEDLRAMPPLVYMQRFLKPVNMRLEEVGTKFETMDILGSVVEGELVHLVIRSKVSAGTIKTGLVKTTGVEVVTLKQFGSGWRAMLSAQVDGLAEKLRIASELRR